LELTRARYRPREYDSEDGPWDPITGGASALLGTLGSLMMGVADLPVEILKAVIKQDAVAKEGSEIFPLESAKANAYLLGDFSNVTPYGDLNKE